MTMVPLKSETRSRRVFVRYSQSIYLLVTYDRTTRLTQEEAGEVILKNGLNSFWTRSFSRVLGVCECVARVWFRQ